MELQLKTSIFDEFKRKTTEQLEFFEGTMNYVKKRLDDSVHYFEKKSRSIEQHSEKMRNDVTLQNEKIKEQLDFIQVMQDKHECFLKNHSNSLEE